MRIQCISRFLPTCCLPTMGTLFSLWQAIMHVEQPTQAFRSIDMPHQCVAFSFSLSLSSGLGYNGCVLGGSSSFMFLANEGCSRYCPRLASRTMGRPSIDQWFCVVDNG